MSVLRTYGPLVKNGAPTQIVRNLYKSYLWVKKHCDCKSSLLREFYSNSEREDFHLKLVSEEFVFKELNQLNSYKSTGLDEIPAKFLKEGGFLPKITCHVFCEHSPTHNTKNQPHIEVAAIIGGS